MTSHIIQAPARHRVPRVAPAADALCLCAFVLLGRESHGIDTGAVWFLTVAWPFLAGWFPVALLSGVYTGQTQRWARLSATVVAATALTMVLRVLFTHRDAPPAFVIVAAIFIAVTTAGWRASVGAYRRLARR